MSAEILKFPGVAELVELVPASRPQSTLTFADIVTAFAKSHAWQIRFAHGVGRWYVWDRRVWREDATGAVLKMARDFTAHLAKELVGRGGASLRGAVTAEKLEKHARTETPLAGSPDEWDNDAFLLGSQMVLSICARAN